MAYYVITVGHMPGLGRDDMQDAPESAETLEQLLALLTEPGMQLVITRTD